MTKAILLDTKQAAELRGTTTRQVQRVAKAGQLPVAAVEGNKQLYRKSDVQRAKMSLK